MNTKQQAQSSKVRSIALAWIYAPVMATSFLALAQPTYADIDNSATASGTYSGNPVASGPSAVSIPVVAANPSLSIAKSIGTVASVALGSNATITDGSDTIIYHYIITNNGNVTITGVTPVDVGPSFGNPQTGGTGSMSVFTLTSGSTTLLPGQIAEFDATYTLSTLDVYRAAGLTVPADAVNNTATGSGIYAGNPVTSPGGSATTTIAAGPRLTVSKGGVLSKFPGNLDPDAEVDDTITYTYTVFNNGNVPISNVVINDTHELVLITPATLFTEVLTTEGPLGTPASTDASGVNGSWDLIQPGATVTFTYLHTVTQTEVDGG